MERIRLAPLCGVTDHIYRTLCFEQGCETAYTEMISAMGYLCAPDQRAQKEDGGENAEHQMEKVVLKQVLHAGQPSFGRMPTSSAACRTIAASISGALAT